MQVLGAIFSADHWQEVFQILRRNRLRTFLTACGVFWGVFMLVVMLGFGKGLENGATKGFSSWALNTIFIWSGETSKAFAGRQPGRRIQMTMEDIEAIATRVEGVDTVVPRNFRGGRQGVNKVTYKDKSGSFGVVGDSVDDLKLEALDITDGRFLNPADLVERRKIAVIGPRVRQALFAEDESPLGATIGVGGTSVTVVGVYQSPAQGDRADWDNGRVFIPRTTFARMYGLGSSVDAMAILVRSDRDAGEVETAAKALLRTRFGVAPNDLRAFNGFNMAREFSKIQMLFRGIAALTWFVGLMTLVAGAIGVSNIMMIAVAERTKEIGIRKALGAPPSSIVAQIVAEAMTLTALSGYLGLVVGVGVVEAAARMMGGASGGSRFFGAPELDFSKALVATSVLVVAGALAGLAPARNAVAIRPVEALAHE